MRRYWATILLAVMLAGLGAYVYFVELPTERAQTAAEAQEKNLLPFKEHEITGVTVRLQTEEIVLAPGENHTWKITAPLRAEADTHEVEALLRALVLGKVSRVVEEKATALAPFGLERPPVVLVLTAGSRREALSLGDIGPISSTLYAMRESDRKILLTDLAAKDFFNKTLVSFRKKEVIPFDQAQADRLRLTYPQTEIVLYRMEDKDAKKWRIRFPVEAEADQAEVRSLLIKLEGLKALGFVDPGREHAALLMKLKYPAVKVTVHAAGLDRAAKLFQPDPASGEAYAVTGPEAAILRINPIAIKDLTKELFALRDKRLLGVSRDDLTLLTVKTREEQYTLINNQSEGQTGTWVLEDQPGEKLDQQAVELFVSRVVDLPAELRTVKEAGPLAPYGLSSPSAEFTATGKDGKTRGRLVLGTRVGGLVYARSQGLPGIYQARADILSQIPAKRDLLAQSN